MEQLTSKKLTTKQYLVVASLLFGLFFGAGNLIFPLHLGQLAGSHWVGAAVGFLVTGVALPLLSVLAVAVTRAEGVFDIGRPLGVGFALVFMVLIHFTIGPLFGTPRTATVSYTVGVAPFVPKADQTLALFLFSLVFFALAFAFAYRENDILTNVGKVLNPVFLVLLFVVLPLRSLIRLPIHSKRRQRRLTCMARSSMAFAGLQHDGCLGWSGFGVTVVTAVRQLGQKRDSDVAKVVAKSGVLAMSAVALIYVLLIVVGAMTLGRFKVSADGGVAFTQLVNAYAGRLGQAVLAVLITVTCLTTAVGLVAAFAQDFHKHFPQLSYHAWLFLTTLASFWLPILAWNRSLPGQRQC